MSDNEQADMFRKFTVSQIWCDEAQYDTFTVLCLFISFPVGGPEEAQVGRVAPATSDLESKEANCPAQSIDQAKGLQESQNGQCW